MVKVISLSERAYQLLAVRKGKRSFSEVIEEMVAKTEGKGDISRLKRFFGTIDDKTAEAWKREVERGRKESGRLRG